MTRYTQPFGHVRSLYNAALLAEGTNVTWDHWISDRGAFANARATVASDLSGCCLPWQTDFIILGTITMILGLMVLFLVRDPIQEKKMRNALGDRLVLVFEGMEPDDPSQELGIKMSDMLTVFHNTTWKCIATQGACGCLPWSAFSFMILWFQRMEIEDILAVVIFACVGGMAAAGGAVGGAVGDWLAKKSVWHHKYSRIIVNHCSILAGKSVWVCCLVVLVGRK